MEYLDEISFAMLMTAAIAATWNEDVWKRVAVSVLVTVSGLLFGAANFFEGYDKGKCDLIESLNEAFDDKGLESTELEGVTVAQEGC